jgi:uncharacterized protein
MSNGTGPMACPVDGTTLVMSERSGIEIDYCPSCRGVWLDRGELDKIIERNAQAAPAAPPPDRRGHSDRDQGYGGQGYGGQGYGGQGYGGHGYRHGKRKKSFLEELFD